VRKSQLVLRLFVPKLFGACRRKRQEEAAKEETVKEEMGRAGISRRSVVDWEGR